MTNPWDRSPYAPKGHNTSAHDETLGQKPLRPEGAQHVSPGRSPGTQSGPIFANF